MNELEDLLRRQLHAAADPIVVPIDDQAVLAEGRRARQERTLRWVLLTIALVAAASAAVFVFWQTTTNQERRAVPDPLQVPTAEPVTPTADASPTVGPSTVPTPDPSGAPANQPTNAPTNAPTTAPTAAPPTQAAPGGQAATLDLGFRDGTGKVQVQSDGAGVRFTGLDAGATGSVTVGAPQGGSVSTVSGSPGRNWVVAVVPRGTTWAAFLDSTTGHGSPAGHVPVPGTDLVGVAAVQDAPEATPRLVYGTADGRVMTSDGRTLPSATFDSIWGTPSTHFIDDRWRVSGYTMVNEGVQGTVRPLDTDLLSINVVGGPSADLVEFVLSLPRGAEPASVTWDLGEDVTVEIARTSKTLPDGRILVHEAFRGTRITDAWAQNRPTATYTNAAGQRVTAPVWKP